MKKILILSLIVLTLLSSVQGRSMRYGHHKSEEESLKINVGTKFSVSQSSAH